MVLSISPLNAAGLPARIKIVGRPVTAEVDGQGIPKPSTATLSAQQYTSSDETVATIVPDPDVPGGSIITAVANPAAGESVSCTITETALATETDGRTEQIQGVINLVLSTPAAPPPPAAAIVFDIGQPF